MSTVRGLLGLAAGLDSDSAALDAEVLLCHCLGKPRSWLYTWPEKNVDPAVEARFRALMVRRAAGHPVAHLTGLRDFWSLELEVTPDTLIPRPDTETLVAWALELPLPEVARVVDLGTGSGAIALALAAERPRWVVIATDASTAALAVARRNADRLCPGRVRLQPGAWFEPLAGEQFDLVVSNPPYVEAGDCHLAQGDVRFEPRSALEAGPRGLDDLSHIARHAPAYIAPGGYLLLEHGCDQGEPVRALLREADFEAVSTRRDLGGLERITGGRRGAR